MAGRFEYALAELTDIQRQAVDWEQGPLLVLAGPGSGKTQVLTCRIARLLDSSRENNFRVLALTFTNKAADEMRGRVAMFVPGLEERANIGTFHSFCSQAHPVNAILNYAYTVLESELRIKAIADGYDPTIGIMHEGRDGSSKFVFDLMEPERPKVDRAVLGFVKATVFDPADFTIRSDGVCRLNPEMARMVVARIST
jgi:hypothetical protein